MGGVGHRIEDDEEPGGKLQRQDRPFAGLQLDRFQHGLAAELVEGARLGECDARPEEDLPVIIPEAEAVRLVRGDAAERAGSP